MRSLLRISSALIPALLLGAPAASVAAAAPLLLVQDDEKPDKRPEVKELLDQLGDHIKKRGKEDDQAIAVIDRLHQEFPESGKKDRKAIVKALGKCFSQKRKTDKDGIRDNGLYMASAVAMKDMGPESVKPLIGLIGHKSHDDDLPFQRRVILSVGATQDEDGVDPLTDLLNNHEPVLQAAAAEALGEYEVLEQKDRKDIFEALLKTLMRVRGQVDTDPENNIARDRYDIIAGPIITSLKRLSGHVESNPHEWQSWWNNNKKKDWDEDL